MATRTSRLPRWLTAAALLAVAPALQGRWVPQAHAATAKGDLGKPLADEAAALFKDGKFLEAAELFERAFALNPDKLVRLRNAGRAYEESGKLAYARLLFERYLNQAPAGPEKEEVKQRIALIDVALHAQKQAAEPVPAKPPVKDVASSRIEPSTGSSASVEGAASKATTEPPGRRWAAWATATAGVGTAIGGLAWVAQVNTANARVVTGWAEGKYEYPGGSTAHQQHEATVRDQRMLAWGAVGVGSAMAIGGLLWAVWPEQSAKIAVVPIAPTGPGLSLTAQF